MGIEAKGLRGRVGNTTQCILSLADRLSPRGPMATPPSGHTCIFAGCSTVGPAVSTTCDLHAAQASWRGVCYGVYLHPYRHTCLPSDMPCHNADVGAYPRGISFSHALPADCVTRMITSTLVCN